MKDNVTFVENRGDLSVYAIKTDLINPQDELNDIVEEFALPSLEDGDILFLSEKMVAISEGRLFHKNAVKPRGLAKFLCKFVHQTSYGPGLGLPMTMQIAIWEVGHTRILLACVAGFFGRIIGKKGWFHEVAGKAVSGIDGIDPATIPPYNNYAILIPSDPDKSAKELKKMINKDVTVAIVDVNDLGSEVLGLSETDKTREEIAEILITNPLGQTNASTPMGIIRKEKK